MAVYVTHEQECCSRCIKVPAIRNQADRLGESVHYDHEAAVLGGIHWVWCYELQSYVLPFGFTNQIKLLHPLNQHNMLVHGAVKVQKAYSSGVRVCARLHII